MNEPKSRSTKRAMILSFFRENIGKRFNTTDMHVRFGSAFRSRVSEINRDPDIEIEIINQTTVAEGSERSSYKAVYRLNSLDSQ